VPEDPLALIVEDPESVVVVNVQALQSAPLYDRLRPYIERATCVKLSEWDAVLSATRRAALAARHKPEQAGEWLVVLDGHYSDADARRLLDVASKQSHNTSAEPARETRDGSGRFAVTEQGTLAVSLLEGRVLVLGTQAWVRAAVGTVAQPVASFSTSLLWRSLGAELGCSARTACVLSIANGSNARQIERALSSAGAKRLGQELSRADSALGVTLRQDLGLGFAAQLGGAEQAQAAERALRDWLYQVNILIRFTGLPAVLDRTRLSTHETVVRGELDVSQAELNAYEERARPLFEREASSCTDAQSP
jgi:hypothetical protein